MGVIGDVDSIDWSMYYHHSNINFSGKINEIEWKNLLERCDKIEREARRRIKRASIKITLNQITIDKIIRRYTKKPHLVFSDFCELISFLFSITIHWKRKDGSQS